MDHFYNHVTASRTSFSDVWETGKPEVCPIVEAPQKKLLDDILQILEMYTSEECDSMDEVRFKNLWNINLPNASFRSLILDIKDGQVASEQRSEGNPPSMTMLTTGFNFDYRHTDEVRFKNLWNLNLIYVNFSSLILDIKDGQVTLEQRSEGKTPPINDDTDERIRF